MHLSLVRKLGLELLHLCFIPTSSSTSEEVHIISYYRYRIRSLFLLFMQDGVVDSLDLAELNDYPLELASLTISQPIL